ncbi:MAG TPA: cytochrome c oxidase assembly protein [Acidimicrobiales bacterium]|nr:cytochrome c oxidase assembly protein [Acidimicrobiales bacterium]
MPGWHLHPDVWAVFIALAFGWMWAVNKWGSPTRRQSFAWWSGYALLLVFSQWPVHDLAEDRLFSVHMTQHLVFSLVAVPMMLVGTPAPVLRRITAPVRRLLGKLMHPVGATLLFNAVVVLTHIPLIVTLTVQNEPLHFVAHFILVSVSFVMWMVALSPLAELPRLGDPSRMVYLFGQSIVPTVPASFLTFAAAPLYAVYANAPRIWGISATADQQLAGAVMKIGGGIVLWGTIVVMFFRWSRAQERYRVQHPGAPADHEQLTWADVERELARTTPPSEPS